MKRALLILMTALLGGNAIAQALQGNPEPPDPRLRPLPFFGSLRKDEAQLKSLPNVNGRAIREMGSRASYSVHGHGLPIQVLDRQDMWRFVINSKGDYGWVPDYYVSTARTFEVIGSESINLRRAAADDAPTVAILEPGTPGRLLSCPGSSDWCEVRSFNRRGFVRRDQIWGLGIGEVIP